LLELSEATGITLKEWALLPWMWVGGVWYERAAGGVGRTGVI
jgi:hypothetical protein